MSSSESTSVPVVPAAAPAAAAAPAVAPAAPAAPAVGAGPLPVGVVPGLPPPQGAFQSASLYVGDLRGDVTESQLFEVFKACGTVASIRVCRDAITRRSLGYAYVNFHNTPDAERALDTLNFQPIAGRCCRIMWSHRDPQRRKSGLGNVYIKNLAKDVTNSSLYDAFSAFGNILSCKVECDESGESKGFGYVHFQKEEDALKAVDALNGKQINGKIVYVAPFQSHRERSQATGGKESLFTNVYVKNIDTGVTDEQFTEMFTPFGAITSGLLMRDEQKVSRGFGFVNYESHEAAKAAIAEMNNKNINGKQLYVSRAMTKHERAREIKETLDRHKIETAARFQNSNLYVRNLADNIDDNELRTIFTPFGTITSAKIMRDDKGNSRGFGFVCFSLQEEATKALAEMNGSLVHQKPLYVALAQKKEQRQQQLRAMHRAPFAYQQAQAPMWYQPTPPGMYGVPRQMMPPAAAAGYAPQQPQQAPQPWRQQNPRTRMGYAPYGQPMGQPGQPRDLGVPLGAGPMGMPYGQRPPRAPVSGGVPMRITRPAAPGGAMAGPPQQRIQRRPAQYQQPLGAGLPQQVSAAPQQAQQLPAAQPEQALPGALAADEYAQLAAQPDELKQALGERLFTHVMEYYPQQQKCGKITGMLLESMDLQLLNSQLDDRLALKVKIDEANIVFEEHQRKQMQQDGADAQN